MKQGHARSKREWIGSNNVGLALVTSGVVLLVVGVGLAAGASTFAVSVDSTNSPVTEGDPLVVTAAVENTGNEVDSQKVTLEVSGIVRDSTAVRIGAGESETVELTWETGSGDGGLYTAVLASEDDEDSTEVSVEEREAPAFVVSIDSTNSPVVEGDVLEVTTIVENTGDTADTQEIALTVNGVERDSQELTLDPGASVSVTLGWETGSGDAGSYEAAVGSEDDNDSTDVTVDEQTDDPAFDVRFAEIPSSVQLGQAISVVAEIDNSGDEAGEQTVTIEVDGEVVSESRVELAPGAATEVGYEFEPDEAGDFDIVAASEDDSGRRTVTVINPEQPAQFTVAVLEHPASLDVGDEYVALAQVTNVGGQPGEGELILNIGDLIEQAMNVSLGSGNSTQIELVAPTEELEPGTEYDVQVLTANDTTDLTLQTNSEDDDSRQSNIDVVSIAAAESVTQGEIVTAEVELKNDAETEGEADLPLSVDGEEVDMVTTTIAGGASDTVTMEWDTSDWEPGTYELVATGGTTREATEVTIEEVQFSVEIIDVTVDDGDVTVELRVVNEAGVEASQEVTASAAGIKQDSSTVQLGANEERTMTFEWNDPSAERGDYDVEVASEADRSLQTLAPDDDDDSGGTVGDGGTTGPALIIVALLGVIVGVYYFRYQ